MGLFSNRVAIGTMVILWLSASESTKVPHHSSAIHPDPHPHHHYRAPRLMTTGVNTESAPIGVNQAQVYTSQQNGHQNDNCNHTHVVSQTPTIPIVPPPPASIPGSHRNPHHLPFFAKKVNKIVNKFTRFFDELFHGGGHYHHHHNNVGASRRWQPSYRPQRPHHVPYPNHNHRARSDFDYYGSCKFGPCHSVQHAVDSYFIRDGFGKFLNKFHHHH